MTGVDLYRHLKQKIDAPFSGSISPLKANRFCEEAMDRVVDRIDRDRLRSQENYDKIAKLIVTEAPFYPQNNSIFLRGPKVTFVSAVGSTVVLVTEDPHLLTGAAGDNVTFYGVESTLPTAADTINSLLNGITFTFGTNLVVSSATTLAITTALPITGSYVNGKAYLVPGNALGKYGIKDYRRLKRVNSFFRERTEISVIGATNATPVVIETSRVTHLRTGSYVFMLGATGNTAIEGYKYLKQLSRKKYQVFSDESLLNPVIGNGTFSGLATLFVIHEKEIKQKVSDEKYSSLSRPTVIDPRWEISENKLKFLPSDQCMKVELDYAKNYPAYIDLTSTTDDYTIWYPQSFLMDVVNEIAMLYGQANREIEIVNIQDKQEVDNT